jgi:hypothetical protein
MSTNSSTFDNKQLIHIASEVFVLFGITYYFSSKNKQLLGYIEELHHRIDEKDERYEKLEKTVGQLSQKVNLLLGAVKNTPKQSREQNAPLSNLRSSEERKNKEIKRENSRDSRRERSEEDTEVSLSKENEQTPIEFVNPRRVTSLTDIKEEEYEDIEQDNERENKPIIQNDDDETNDSDLDNEIREELNALVEDDTVLKKDE